MGVAELPLSRKDIRKWLTHFQEMSGYIDRLSTTIGSFRRAKVKQTDMSDNFEEQLRSLGALEVAISQVKATVAGGVKERLITCKYEKRMQWKEIPASILGYELSTLQQYDDDIIREIEDKYREVYR